jgi:hypothetical protein
MSRICNTAWNYSLMYHLQGPSCQALQETAREGNLLPELYFMTDSVKESFDTVSLNCRLLRGKISSGDVTSQEAPDLPDRGFDSRGVGWQALQHGHRKELFIKYPLYHVLLIFS